MKIKLLLSFALLAILQGCVAMMPDVAYEAIGRDIMAEIDRDKSGDITKDELYHVLKDDEESISQAKKEHLTMKDYCEKEFYKVDLDKNDKISFKEFIKGMKKKIREDN